MFTQDVTRYAASAVALAAALTGSPVREVTDKIHVCSATEVWQTFICHKTGLRKG